MTVRYVIGPAYAVVRGGAVVVLPERVSPELVDELWTALGERAGVVPVLEVLTGAFGASLASLPPFAMAVADGRRVQVAARGATSVTVARADGWDHVSGEGVTTWAERTFEDVVDLAVQVGVAEPAGELVDARALPLDAGVVLVASVGSRLTDEAAPAAPTHRPAPAPEPWMDDAGDAAVDAVPAVSGVGVARLGGAGPAAASFGATFAPEATIAPESTVLPSVTVTGDDVPRPAPDDAPADGAADGDAADDGSADVSAHGPADVSTAAGPAFDLPVEETTGFGHLWGSTVHRAVEAAAVRPPEEDEEDGDEPAAAASSPPPPPSPAPDPSPGDAPGDDDGSTQLEPSEPEDAADVPDVADVADVANGAGGFEDEVEGSTVMSSAIADLRATAAVPVGGAASAGVAGGSDLPPPPGPAFAPGALPGRPTILARSCTAGHPNPPQRDDCATCGQALLGEARQVPRPALGVMAVSGGPRVTLDRPVVVGRRPRSPRAASDDLPRLVTVPSPQQDISRSHAEVRLEGWHVLVSDMSTTNGTTLLRSGQPPLRLHPGEPVLVVAQDVVDLGDGVTLTFEGIL